MHYTGNVGIESWDLVVLTIMVVVYFWGFAVGRFFGKKQGILKVIDALKKLRAGEWAKIRGKETFIVFTLRPKGLVLQGLGRKKNEQVL